MNNLQVAVNMARWSNMAYAYDIKVTASNQGIPCPRIIKPPPDSDAPVLALVGVIGNSVIVSFRGTVIANIEDDSEKWNLFILGMLCNVGGAFIEDDELHNAVLEVYGGKAHLGFTDLLDKVWNPIQSEVHVQLGSDRELYLTGHSQGGALATLAAYRLQKAGVPVNAVYTFGSPRVFDEKLYRDYAIPHFRFEHKNDIVPLLPPHAAMREFINKLLDRITKSTVRLHNVDYKHVGHLMYINENSEIEEDSPFLSLKRGVNLLGGIDRLVSDHAMGGYLRTLGSITELTEGGQHRLLMSVRIASIPELDAMLMQGDLQQKISAAQETGRRGFGSQTTYDLLVRVVVEGARYLSVQAYAHLDYFRQHCLIALGCLYGIQFAALPTHQIAVIPLISQILQDPRETTAMKGAAVWSLAVINRRDDPPIRALFAEVVNRSTPELKGLANDALHGRIALFPRGDWNWLMPYRFASVAELNDLLFNPGQLNPSAIVDELGARGFGNVKTYEALAKLIQMDPVVIQPNSNVLLNPIRRNALWTLGQLNRTQNWLTPSEYLPGRRAIEDVLKRTIEHELVKLAAVEAIWMLDRSSDKCIRSALRIARRDRFTSVKQEAEMALSGQVCPIPLPSSQRKW
jgi:hypothetical protein